MFAGHLRAASPHATLIESSFCGPKPIATASVEMAAEQEVISLSSAVNRIMLFRPEEIMIQSTNRTRWKEI